MRTLPTMSYVDEIIRRFGGVRSMARTIDKPASTVGSWKARGSIPDEHKNDVLSAAKGAGIALKPADFFPHKQQEAAE